MNMNNQIKYPVAEQFVSINGEGTKAGELAVFIRFKGCNLNCSYCDTQWANRQDTPAVEKTAAELVADVCRTGIDNVTMTGGWNYSYRRRTVAADRTCGSDKRTVVCGKSC